MSNFPKSMMPLLYGQQAYNVLSLFAKARATGPNDLHSESPDVEEESMSCSRRAFLGASAASLWGAGPTPPGVKSAEARGGVAATQSDLPMATAAKVYKAG